METTEKPVRNDAQLTVRLPRALLETFAVITLQRKQSQGDVMRRAIQTYINRHNKGT